MCEFRKGIPSREICKSCFKVNPVGFYVPDDIWNEVVPKNLRDNVLCLWCFISLADEKLVRWDEYISFFPVSYASHLDGFLGYNRL